MHVYSLLGLGTRRRVGIGIGRDASRNVWILGCHHRKRLYRQRHHGLPRSLSAVSRCQQRSHGLRDAQLYRRIQFYGGSPGLGHDCQLQPVLGHQRQRFWIRPERSRTGRVHQQLPDRVRERPPHARSRHHCRAHGNELESLRSPLLLAPLQRRSNLDDVARLLGPRHVPRQRVHRTVALRLRVGFGPGASVPAIRSLVVLGLPDGVLGRRQGTGFSDREGRHEQRRTKHVRAVSKLVSYRPHAGLRTESALVPGRHGFGSREVQPQPLGKFSETTGARTREPQRIHRERDQNDSQGYQGTQRTKLPRLLPKLTPRRRCARDREQHRALFPRSRRKQSQKQSRRSRWARCCHSF
mmetsp:Transcript_9463/g.19858  ORF Transcript_9463/g.19858 Transcript_9463/m.19858 type:complete len:354 (+) Transcript_9463:138-1199(+)